MTKPLLIEGRNLSYSWSEVLNHIINNTGKEISPLIISMTDFDENKDIRNVLDESLLANNFSSIQTVSETIFPDSLYKFCDENRFNLYEEYLNNISRIKKVNRSNRNGTYFERLIAYDAVDKNINQLEIIISAIQDDHRIRRSKLQASIFSPLKDHINSPYQGFPCLQHVTFYKTKNNTLVLNSFYAIQHLYKKAYGNWLGLINLGKFVAKETNLTFERLNCHVGVECLDELTNRGALKLYEELNY